MARETPLPRLPAQSSWGDFFQGLSLPFTAIGLIFRSPKLRRLAALSSLVTLAALSAVVYFLVRYTGQLVFLVLGGRPQTWWGQAGSHLLTVLTFIVLLAIGANTVPLLLLSPLQDPISEATEEALGKPTSPFSLPLFFRQTLVSIGHTLARITLLLAGHVLLFGLNWIPVFGNMVWTLIAAIWTAGWIAAEYLDPAMARHLYRFREVQAIVLQKLSLCLGFGAAVYAILWIPVLNFFFIPVAVVAGTLLFVRLRESEALGPPSPRAPWRKGRHVERRA